MLPLSEPRSSTPDILDLLERLSYLIRNINWTRRELVSHDFTPALCSCLAGIVNSMAQSMIVAYTPDPIVLLDRLAYLVSNFQWSQEKLISYGWTPSLCRYLKPIIFSMEQHALGSSD